MSFEKENCVRVVKDNLTNKHYFWISANQSLEIDEVLFRLFDNSESKEKRHKAMIRKKRILSLDALNSNQIHRDIFDNTIEDIADDVIERITYQERLAQLPKSYRIAVQALLMGYSKNEIGQILHVSRRTVSRMFCRMKKMYAKEV